MSEHIAYLDWFPKAFTPGDMDGAGAIKLLGTSKLTPVEILVRETAQNSWDARNVGEELRYSIHLRTLSGSQVNLLRTHVFADGAESLGLGNSLAKSQVQVLEISDRGTSGLNGPIRNDRIVPKSQPTNFIDLILNVGAPPDTATGGGTYGFGKTVAYSSSNSGTVLFWSHSRENGGIESRLIGSGIGDGFTRDGLRYTGRHWWGRVPSQDVSRVEPITGAEAELLGNKLFSKGFCKDETGTSLLIIDPELTDLDATGPAPTDLARDYVNRVSTAILRHLWPKLIPDPRIHQMNIQLWFENTPVSIPDPSGVPFLNPFVSALKAVRDSDNGGYDSSTDLFTKVWTIDCKRPRKALGHLGLTRGLIPPSSLPPEGWGREAHHVCLMRNEAELVVEYLPCNELSVAGFQWGAVFKPMADLDPTFAKSEPPTHDAWHRQQLPSPETTFVNQALLRSKKTANDAIAPEEGSYSGIDRTKFSTVGLANQLAGFVEQDKGNRATARAGRKPSQGTRRNNPSPVIKSFRDHGGYSHRGFEILVELPKNSIGSARVRANLAVGFEGGGIPDRDAITILGWRTGTDVEFVDNGDSTTMNPGQSKWLVFTCEHDVSIDVQLKSVWL